MPSSNSSLDIKPVRRWVLQHVDISTPLFLTPCRFGVLPHSQRVLCLCARAKYNDMKGTERYHIPGSRT